MAEPGVIPSGDVRPLTEEEERARFEAEQLARHGTMGPTEYSTEGPSWWSPKNQIPSPVDAIDRVLSTLGELLGGALGQIPGALPLGEHTFTDPSTGQETPPTKVEAPAGEIASSLYKSIMPQSAEDLALNMLPGPSPAGTPTVFRPVLKSGAKEAAAEIIAKAAEQAANPEYTRSVLGGPYKVSDLYSYRKGDPLHGKGKEIPTRSVHAGSMDSALERAMNLEGGHAHLRTGKGKTSELFEHILAALRQPTTTNIANLVAGQPDLWESNIYRDLAVRDPATLLNELQDIYTRTLKGRRDINTPTIYQLDKELGVTLGTPERPVTDADANTASLERWAKANNIEALIYRNAAEDPGSLSVNFPDRARLLADLVTGPSNPIEMRNKEALARMLSNVSTGPTAGNPRKAVVPVAINQDLIRPPKKGYSFPSEKPPSYVPEYEKFETADDYLASLSPQAKEAAQGIEIGHIVNLVKASKKWGGGIAVNPNSADEATLNAAKKHANMWGSPAAVTQDEHGLAFDKAESFAPGEDIVDIIFPDKDWNGLNKNKQAALLGLGATAKKMTGAGKVELSGPSKVLTKSEAFSEMNEASIDKGGQKGKYDAFVLQDKDGYYHVTHTFPHGYGIKEPSTVAHQFKTNANNWTKENALNFIGKHTKALNANYALIKMGENEYQTKMLLSEGKVGLLLPDKGEVVAIYNKKGELDNKAFEAHKEALAKYNETKLTRKAKAKESENSLLDAIVSLVKGKK